MRLDPFNPSIKVEDRRGWIRLGYDRDGNVYSQAKDGTIYVQPWRPYRSPKTGELEKGWGDQQAVDGHGSLTADVPVGVLPNGKPRWWNPNEDREFGACNTCRATKKKDTGGLW